MSDETISDKGWTFKCDHCAAEATFPQRDREKAREAAEEERWQFLIQFNKPLDLCPACRVQIGNVTVNG